MATCSSLPPSSLPLPVSPSSAVVLPWSAGRPARARGAGSGAPLPGSTLNHTGSDVWRRLCKAAGAHPPPAADVAGGHALVRAGAACVAGAASLRAGTPLRRGVEGWACHLARALRPPVADVWRAARPLLRRCGVSVPLGGTRSARLGRWRPTPAAAALHGSPPSLSVSDVAYATTRRAATVGRQPRSGLVMSSSGALPAHGGGRVSLQFWCPCWWLLAMASRVPRVACSDGRSVSG
jgi:hypothetical protein